MFLLFTAYNDCGSIFVGSGDRGGYWMWTDQDGKLTSKTKTESFFGSGNYIALL